MNDFAYMARAIQLAKLGNFTAHPNPRVGCVIVQDRDIIAEGWHKKTGEPHAEAIALAAAGDRARGATVYVTLEPCSHTGRTPPCADALIAAGVGRVVVGMQDPNPSVAGSGVARLRDAGIEVSVGVLESEARLLNPGFIRRMERGLPYVRVKLAVSLDGRTAMANGESKWITGDAARADVQKLRARSSAIVTGAGTILADNPLLTVRTEEVIKQPLRVIVDTNLSTPANSKIFSTEGEVLVVTVSEDEEAARMLVDAGAEVIQLSSAAHGVDLLELMQYLAENECNEVMIEAGATLAGSAVASGIVNELVVYIAPHLMGADSKGMFALPGLQEMEERVGLQFQDIRMVGNDLRITALVQDKD
ncbi:MAG: bifunctional diaminohydroxyphosphoribosylaminopyrimidine deaminase/5-amino-6-(5-phosphoribosylamino)uracil reductase RibD [Acidiferrobacterales bacterium]|nr:bifunctional diaminohydroxyphosphoribosylaminopyrimidine deaminase/5-amino-6-(5-phosphoribosylamino)uracil reductase RibD [Acidiferrobacterales bacterium]